MRDIKSIAVYCASSNKVRSSYMEAAEKLGAIFAAQGIRLIYGDGGIGLMAAVAKGVLDAGGEAVGVIPRFMVEQEWNLILGLWLEVRIIMGKVMTCYWMIFKSMHVQNQLWMPILI